MYQYLQQQASTDLGWGFYIPLIAILIMVILAVPVWVSLGLGTIGILYFTEALPLSLMGDSLFAGIDHFALIAIPLFILTGDILARTGLANKLLDVAEA
ncbi:MAG: TRAP-type mannitol/chloroaromatic compound transport system permease large subunit, partial [Cellvibrionaceae bacterium]